MEKRYFEPSDSIYMSSTFLSSNWILPIEKPEFCFALIISIIAATTQRMLFDGVDSRSTRAIILDKQMSGLMYRTNREVDFRVDISLPMAFGSLLSF
jgi:hypothetical protein